MNGIIYMYIIRIYKIQYEQYMIVLVIRIYTIYIYISYIYSYLLHFCPIFSGETSWLKQVTPLLSSDAGPMTPEEAPKCSRIFGKNPFFFWGDTTQMIIF